MYKHWQNSGQLPFIICIEVITFLSSMISMLNELLMICSSNCVYLSKTKLPMATSHTLWNSMCIIFLCIGSQRIQGTYNISYYTRENVTWDLSGETNSWACSGTRHGYEAASQEAEAEALANLEAEPQQKPLVLKGRLHEAETKAGFCFVPMSVWYQFAVSHLLRENVLHSLQIYSEFHMIFSYHSESTRPPMWSLS